MILILDSSSLITLARIGRLDLLRQIAGTAHIPEAVYEEVVQGGQDDPLPKEPSSRVYFLAPVQ